MKLAILALLSFAEFETIAPSSFTRMRLRHSLVEGVPHGIL
jgi:hypothetical protein